MSKCIVCGKELGMTSKKRFCKLHGDALECMISKEEQGKITGIFNVITGERIKNFADMEKIWKLGLIEVR